MYRLKSAIFLRDVPGPLVGGILAFGAGGLFYLTLTKLIPEGESRRRDGSHDRVRMAAGT